MVWRLFPTHAPCSCRAIIERVVRACAPGSAPESAYACSVTHSSLDPAQLNGMAGHIAYEVEMLVLTSRELLARGLEDLSFAVSPSDAERLLNNLLVESFLIHARSLDDFLTYGQSQRRPQDVLALDYNDNWIPTDVLAGSVRRLINRRVAHLTIDRLAFLVGIQPAIISRRLLARYREFVASLPALKWPALERAATTAGEHLDHLDTLDLPEFVVSTTTQTVVTSVSDFSPYFATGYGRGSGHPPH